MTAAPRAVDVASVSEPARLGSEIRTARSTPMAMASYNERPPTSGPIESAVTLPPSTSRSCRAISRAGRSKGFRAHVSGSRTTRPSGASSTTDLMQTMMFRLMWFFSNGKVLQSIMFLAYYYPAQGAGLRAQGKRNPAPCALRLTPYLNSSSTLLAITTLCISVVPS